MYAERELALFIRCRQFAAMRILPVQRCAPLELLSDRAHVARRQELCALLLATALAIASPVHAQGRVGAAADSTRHAGEALVGSVVDVVGKPMEKIEVYIAGTDRRAQSDARGWWRFPNPPTGPRVVVARQIGYVPYVREVVVSSRGNDTVSLVLRRYPRTLTAVEVNARSLNATADANILAERLMQNRVGAGRFFTRDEILKMRPYSVAELITGIPGIAVARGQNEVVVTSTRAGVGIMNFEGQQCQLQFFLDNTPLSNEGVASLDPMMFRSVEVYPQALVLTGLAMRPDKCRAIVINTIRR